MSSPKIFIVNKARESIAEGQIKTCINQLLNSFNELNKDDPFTWEFRNELVVIKSRLVRLEQEKSNIHYSEYDIQQNKLTADLLRLLDRMEKEINVLSFDESEPKNGNTYKVELILDMDFEKTTDTEIQVVLEKIAKILKTRPNELKIMTKRSGSIILEMDLSAETLVKLNSLVKLGVLGLKGIQPLSKGWEWMGAEEFKVFLEKVDFLGTNFSSINLSEANLSGANFRRANLFSMNLSGANLSNTDLRGGCLRKVNFSRANLFSADLRGADLIGANFLKADLRGINLVGANFISSSNDVISTNLSNLDLSEADLHGVDLREASFHGSNLTGANLSRGNFSKADLSKANLRGANLSEGGFDKTNFRGADLSEANFHGAYLSEADFNGSNLKGANFTKADLRRVDLSKCMISGIVLNYSIVQIDQAKFLQKMNVDVSRVIFVDDEGKKIDGG